MNAVSKLFYWLRGKVLEHNGERKISQLKDGNYKLFYDIPYVSQYESDDLFWAQKLCGMACFKMILLSLGCPTPKLVELGGSAMETGCYKKDPKDPMKLIGMLHVPFLKFTEKYGLSGKLIWHIGASAVAGEVLKNNFVVASVSSQIGHMRMRPASKEGHLVLVHGFKVSGGSFCNGGRFYALFFGQDYYPLETIVLLYLYGTIFNRGFGV